MNYNVEIQKLLANFPFQTIPNKLVPWALTYLSPKTFTGRNAFYLIREIQNKNIKISDIATLTNAQLFPDIYLNERITIENITLLENIRFTELKMISLGVWPQIPIRYAYGYPISEELGALICGNSIVESPGFVYSLTYDEMVKTLSDVGNDVPYNIEKEMLKVCELGVKIYQYKILI